MTLAKLQERLSDLIPNNTGVLALRRPERDIDIPVGAIAIWSDDVSVYYRRFDVEPNKLWNRWRLKPVTKITDLLHTQARNEQSFTAMRVAKGTRLHTYRTGVVRVVKTNGWTRFCVGDYRVDGVVYTDAIVAVRSSEVRNVKLLTATGCTLGKGRPVVEFTKTITARVADRAPNGGPLLATMSERHFWSQSREAIEGNFKQIIQIVESGLRQVGEEVTFPIPKVRVSAEQITSNFNWMGQGEDALDGPQNTESLDELATELDNAVQVDDGYLMPARLVANINRYRFDCVADLRGLAGTDDAFVFPATAFKDGVCYAGDFHVICENNKKRPKPALS